MKSFTVYYIVGQPRSGSTFVGDHIARSLNIVNAGEVWQTFRTMNLVRDGLGRGHGRWHKGDQKKVKASKISSNPFWYRVLGQHEKNPYSALVNVAASHWGGLVDCSKTDVGIDEYRALGCRVEVIHTVRAFTTWQASLTNYRHKYGLSVPRRGRLLLNYIKLNRRYRRYRNKYPYSVVPQEQLKNICDLLLFYDEIKIGNTEYMNAEMFGAPGFSGGFDSRRATTNVTRLDRILYAIIGISLTGAMNK